MSASCIGILPLIVAAPFKHAFLFTLLAGNRQGIYSEIQRAEFTSWLYSYSPERKGNDSNILICYLNDKEHLCLSPAFVILH